MRPARSQLSLIATSLLFLGLALACGGKGNDSGAIDLPEGSWQDSSCGLVWQQELGTTDHWAGASQYCSALELGDLAWRLPSIGELRCLVDGCQDTALDGECEVSDDCAGVGCLTTACDGCEQASDDIGCYWSSALGTTCDDPLWSSSAQGEEAAWVLHFLDGSIFHEAVSEGHYARCVSDG